MQEVPVHDYAIINFGAFWRPPHPCARGNMSLCHPRYATESVNYMGQVKCLILAFALSPWFDKARVTSSAIIGVGGGGGGGGGL